MVGGAIGGGLGTQTTDTVKRINRAEQDQEMQREGEYFSRTVRRTPRSTDAG